MNNTIIHPDYLSDKGQLFFALLEMRPVSQSPTDNIYIRCSQLVLAQYLHWSRAKVNQVMQQIIQDGYVLRPQNGVYCITMAGEQLDHILLQEEKE